MACDEPRGLFELCFVETERGMHGRLEVTLAVLGRAMVQAQSSARWLEHEMP